MGTHSNPLPPAYNLPLVWNQASIKSKKYMFGFTGAALCSFYITDMVLVWTDTSTLEEIYKKALDLGITDFDGEKLQVLKQNIAAVVNDSPSEVAFPSASSDLISVDVKISEYLSWPFVARLCDPKSSLDFFRGLCCQSLANHGLLLYKQFQLENMIRIRDEYILYLEENYKTVNGTELMDKYRRQHPESVRLLQNYVKPGFESDVGARYSDYLNQTTAEEPRLWREFGLMAKHQKEWTSYSRDSVKSVNLQEKRLSDHLSESGKKRRRSDENEELKRIQRVKLKSEGEMPVSSAQSESNSKRISPTKRKRLGLVGKR